jgi:hypothetical protein
MTTIITISNKDYEVIQEQDAKKNLAVMGIKTSLILKQVKSNCFWTAYRRTNGNFTKPARCLAPKGK